jgi:hypothetical protein
MRYNKEVKMEDRRSITRWRIGRQIKVKLEGAESFIDCFLQDINLKGARVSLGLPLLQKDAFSKVFFLLSADFTLRVEIWVAWQKNVEGKNQYGIYFSKIKDADKERIYKLLRNQIPRQLNQRWWQGPQEGGKVMGSESLEDRRIFERFHVNVPIRFFDSANDQEGTAEVFDISAKGLGLITREKLPENTPLEIWIDVPDKGEPLYSRGEVVWSMATNISEFRAGVNLQKADLMGLSRVLRTV